MEWKARSDATPSWWPPQLKLPGFSFREELSGSYWRLDAPLVERPIRLRLRASVPDGVGFLQSRLAQLSGRIDAEELATAADIDGAVSFRMLEEQRSTYRFGFRGDDGRAYEVCGQKEWNALSPLDALTVLPASLYDEHGKEVGRTTLRFDVRADWARWLASLRVLVPD
jgi:hypothetical protein